MRKYYSSVLNNYKYGAINNITPNFVTIFILAIMLAFFNFVKFITLEFIGVMLRLFQTLGNFNNTLNLVINSHVHLEKLNLLEKNKVTKKENVVLTNFEPENKMAIKLENVSFKYFGSESYIFENINLEIMKDKHTVITGDNGSGKSTLLGLISGILIPDEGTVTISSSKFAYVGATPLIISGTLRDNFIYGNENNISDEEMDSLAEAYKLFNNNLELNLDSEVSNKSLSSGQMQKISFIRAMLSKPDILILDEATSNLDSDSKDIIKSQLKNSKVTIVNSTHNTDEVDFDIRLNIEVNKDLRILRTV